MSSILKTVILIALTVVPFVVIIYSVTQLKFNNMENSIHYDTIPEKQKLYGTPALHIRPIYIGKDEKGHKMYGIFIYPDGEGYKVTGAGRTGMDSYQSIKMMLRAGNFKNTVYLYSIQSLNHCSSLQAQNIVSIADYPEETYLQTLTK